ncbi:hypothetical protein SAY86_019325 [Trapa natans]|uniref:BHLH domain-containing protein n=1 Tax=Trapa natans TaxID=22666 RepID=A0AAN7LKU6_TRANT|nr:hypothetical protein SAY86_019325 [Trapa natans]
MVKTGDSWVFKCLPAWKPPDLNGMGTSHEPKKQELETSYMNLGSSFSPSLVGLMGLVDSGIPPLNFSQVNASNGSNCYLPFHFEAFHPASDPYGAEKASLASQEPDGRNLTGWEKSQGKKFLVFDQSEKGTRLVYSSSRPLFHKLELLRETPSENFLRDKGEHPTNLYQFDLDSPAFLEESGENDIIREETEIHEATEEINALLYSDDNDSLDWQEGEDEDDEVTSTGHTPTLLMKCGEEHGHVETRLDEIGNFSHLNKRQRPTVIEFEYFNSLPRGSPLKKLNSSSEEDVSDANSSFAVNLAKEEAKPALDGGLSRKDKIHQMFKTLEGIVPGAEGKDPVVVLEKAIQHLKTMELQAKVLGISFH